MKVFKTNKIAFFVHRTRGAAMDSRLRKMITTLSNNGIPCRGLLWQKNNKNFNYKYNELSWLTVHSLWFYSRKEPKGSWPIHIFEIIQETIFAFFKIFIYRPSWIIIQNHRYFLLAALMIIIYRPLYGSRIVWDLRELPNGFMKGYVAKYIFSKIIFNCNSSIVANVERYKYMVSIYGKRAMSSTMVVPNYESISFIDKPYANLNYKLKKFLKGRRYIYLQNPIGKDRLLLEVVSAIFQLTDMVLVVTGNVPNELLNDIYSKFDSDKVAKSVYFTGLVPEINLLEYIDNAYAAIVVYKKNKKNNELAEPNKLYQSIARGTPVIVGINDSISKVVKKTKGGVVLIDDGSSVQSISDGITELINNYELYKKNSIKNRGVYSWEKNEDVLCKVVTGSGDCQPKL
jgi:glycosyltransferase involved in cell wall biosynthesis